MDGPLVAATTAALASAARTAQTTTDFLRDVPEAHLELEPVLIELFDLRGLLDRLQDVALHGPLFVPLVGVVHGCTDICGRIDRVLSGCGDGPLSSERWVHLKVAVEIQRLNMVMGFCRRTVQLTLEAVDQ